MSDKQQLLIKIDDALKEAAELYYRSEREGDILNADVLTLMRSFIIGHCTRRTLAAGVLRCASTDAPDNDGLDHAIVDFLKSCPQPLIKRFAPRRKMNTIRVTTHVNVAPPRQLWEARIPWWLRWAMSFAVLRVEHYAWKEGEHYVSTRSLLGYREAVGAGVFSPNPYPHGELPFVIMPPLP